MSTVQDHFGVTGEFVRVRASEDTGPMTLAEGPPTLREGTHRTYRVEIMVGVVDMHNPGAPVAFERIPIHVRAADPHAAAIALGQAIQEIADRDAGRS